MAKIFGLLEGATDAFGLSAYFAEAISGELQRQIEESGFVEPLKSAISYALFPGGKRIRPLFALLLCHDLGGDASALLPAATALEYIHCSSLIHDDLPALDNDDMRRGRPSCHKKYGEATALLAGNALVSFAFECICSTKLAADARVELAAILGTSYSALCNGQQQDMTGVDDILSMYAKKTGALFASAARFAAVVAALDEAGKAACSRFGEEVGVYFQIVDDYIDVYGDDRSRGREGSSDAKNGKTTVFLGREEESYAVVSRVQKNVQSALEEVSRYTPGSAMNFKGAGWVLGAIEKRMRTARSLS